ncbi:MAG: hypothetical protein ACOC6B_04605 [Thermodesulfobacteriota bacterium]
MGSIPVGITEHPNPLMVIKRMGGLPVSVDKQVQDISGFVTACEFSIINE